MSLPLVIDPIVDLTPLAHEIGSTAAVPPALEAALLGDYGTDAGQLRLYTVIDAAKITGLVEMLEYADIPHKCLYIGPTFEAHGDIAPWLVELSPDDALLRNLMTATDSPEADAPWHFWRRQVGVLLRSEQPFDVVWAHLRKYTRVKDDTGAPFFLRFFEPDFLAALLGQAKPCEVAGFFAALHSVIAIEQPRPDVWGASVLSAAPDLDAEPTGLTLTDRSFRAMRLVEYNRHARKICIAHNLSAADHGPFVDTAVRLQTHGFSHDTNLLDCFRVLQQVDHTHHPSIWKTIASRDYSMGFILYNVRRHFGLEKVSA